MNLIDLTTDDHSDFEAEEPSVLSLHNSSTM